MYLEKLIKKLKEASCSRAWERRNVAINIAICEMQINIRDARQIKIRYGQRKRS